MAEDQDVQAGQPEKKDGFSWGNVLDPRNHLPGASLIFKDHHKKKEAEGGLTADEQLAGNYIWAAGTGAGGIMGDHLLKQATGRTLWGNVRSLFGMKDPDEGKPKRKGGFVTDVATTLAIGAVPGAGPVVAASTAALGALGDRDVKGALNHAAIAKRAADAAKTAPAGSKPKSPNTQPPALN